MAAGEVAWSFDDQEIHSFKPRLADPIEYDAKLLTEEAEQRTSKENPDSLPRISMKLELLETEGEVGKNIVLYHDIYLSLKEGKDGVAMTNRAGGIGMLGKALGAKGGFSEPITIKGVKCLPPKEVLQWLRNRHGEVVRLKVRNEKQRDGTYRSRVDSFIKVEGRTEEEYETQDETPETDLPEGVDTVTGEVLEDIPEIDASDIEQEEEQQVRKASGVKNGHSVKAAPKAASPKASSSKVTQLPARRLVQQSVKRK